MHRRSFLSLGASALVVPLAGCSSNETADEKTVTVYQEKTEIEVDGGQGVWTWIADIDHSGYGQRIDVEATITLYDDSGAEIDTFSRIVKNIDPWDSQYEHEVSYISDPEVINRIVDYNVELRGIPTN